eukprot:5205859-Alexandrium_andersonii.AAC.1
MASLVLVMAALIIFDAKRAIAQKLSASKQIAGSTHYKKRCNACVPLAASGNKARTFEARTETCEA